MDEYPVARIACEGAFYRGTVWQGASQLAVAIKSYRQGWQAGKDADWLCQTIRNQSDDQQFPCIPQD